MTTPTPMPDEFPRDVDDLLAGIDALLEEAAAAIPTEQTAQAPQPAPGSTEAGNTWAGFDPALRELKPSCGTIYRTGGGTFVVCQLDQGHADSWCRGEDFKWQRSALPASTTAAPQPLPAALAHEPAPTAPEEAPTAAEVLAQLHANRDSSYFVLVTMGPYRINPSRLDPTLLNDLDRSMVAAMLRHAANRMDPLTGPVAYEACECEEQEL